MGRSARGLTRDAKAVSGKPEYRGCLKLNKLKLRSGRGGAAEELSVVPQASFAPHCRPPTPLVVEVSEKSESNFWVLKISGTFICYRGCLNLNCYIVKKKFFADFPKYSTFLPSKLVF